MNATDLIVSRLQGSLREQGYQSEGLQTLTGLSDAAFIPAINSLVAVGLVRHEFRPTHRGTHTSFYTLVPVEKQA